MCALQHAAWLSACLALLLRSHGSGGVAWWLRCAPSWACWAGLILVCSLVGVSMRHEDEEVVRLRGVGGRGEGRRERRALHYPITLPIVDLVSRIFLKPPHTTATAQHLSHPLPTPSPSCRVPRRAHPRPRHSFHPPLPLRMEVVEPATSSLSLSSFSLAAPGCRSHPCSSSPSDPRPERNLLDL